ncbi:STAS domain-containing protein [Actinoplanes solisilvae]|uniref:STAS domain-containing protein n=1 Tax=Actinoplanes solisilvae TaxID=2486853 RepID=UPI0013E3F432|nr:STAS domain-containing protein [Actinoplanes solisilvae]
MAPDSDGATPIREADLGLAEFAFLVNTAPPFTISTTQQPCGTLTVTVAGELDYGTASTLYRQICELLHGQQGGGLELDFSRLAFCDLAGWRAIHAVAETATKRRYRTFITAGAPCLDTVLELCAIPEFLGYTPPQKPLS